MSQTNHTRSQEPTSTQADIVKRLETLNRWQEEQKKLLQERQNVQRRQLGFEQRNMYTMLGLLHPQTDKEMPRDEDSLASGGEDRVPHENENTSEEDEHITNEEEEDTQKTTSGYYTTSGAVDMPLEVPPKRSFLRRGAGLKQRFNIDPEELRLNNLPPYKFVNAHPKLRSQLQQHNTRRSRISNVPPPVPPKPAPKTKSPTTTLKAASKTLKDEPPLPLDAMEKRFQELLFSSKTACNSTPDAKLLSSSSSSYGGADSATSASAKPRFVRLATPQEDQLPIGATASDEPQTLAVSWAKVLDSQQLRPLPVHEMRSKGILRRSTQTETDEENLSIFELLEQKANNGTIDMNSSCIKRFMINNLQRNRNGDAESEADDGMEIPVDNRLKEAVLQPLVNEVLLDDQNDAESESNEGNDDDGDEENFKECEVKSPRSQPVRQSRVHVRFAEENDTREYVDEVGDSLSETSTVEATADETEETTTTMEPHDTSDDLFQQFKEILFSALQSRAAEDRGDKPDEPSIPMNPKVAFEMPVSLPPSISIPLANDFTAPSTLSSNKAALLAEDLQSQSNIIRERLAELEKEITIFKTNNMELIKAKQEHELERAQFVTEQQEAADRVKDDKIQMEIYLHDERMKFEQERAKLAEQTRRSKANSKERKEISRLKQELDAVQLQLKEKEHSHAAAQARLRTQIRNLERDQKAIYEDIERLNKENKRLQCENVKIGRENNNKMLQEINRNIAKLAPKLTTVTNVADEDFSPRVRPPFMSVVKSNRKNSLVVQTQKQSPLMTAPSSARCSVGRRHSKLTKSKIIKAENTSDSELEEPQVSAVNHVISDDNGDEDDDDDVDTAKELQAIAAAANTHSSSSKTQAATKIASIKSESSLMTNIESSSSNMTTNDATNSATSEFKREIVNADGSKDIWYPNGNLKKISADGMLIRMLYFNKDIKETSINEGTVKYYYAETNTWHTTYLDGLEILEFPNGQTEHRHKSGLVEVHFPNNSIKVTNPADTSIQEEWRFADGTTLTQMRSGDKIIKLPNGQKEIHTKLNKRREYPDGTVKLVYPDGSQETRYSNGRLRLKDKDGKLVMDTETETTGY